eukprot:3160851-Prymnesium_polylepis.1
MQSTTRLPTGSTIGLPSSSVSGRAERLSQVVAIRRVLGVPANECQHVAQRRPSSHSVGPVLDLQILVLLHPCGRLLARRFERHELPVVGPLENAKALAVVVRRVPRRDRPAQRSSAA